MMKRSKGEDWEDKFWRQKAAKQDFDMKGF
jgi:hypothetical protein